MANEYPTGELTLTAEACRAFAHATDDDNPVYGSGKLAPPMAVVLASVPLGVRVVLSDQGVIGDAVRLSRLLHLEEDIRWCRPLCIGDRLLATPRLVASEQSPSGELIVVACEVRDATGALVVESASRVLVRERRPRGLSREATQPGIDHGIDFTVNWTVAEDQSIRYADAAGDANPIHVDDDAARAAGFSGKVLHGMCTMAFAQRAVVDSGLAGDPTRLRRLRVRFTKPVYMGHQLALTGWRGADGAIGFEVRNQRGRQVIQDGIAEVDPS